MEKSENILIAGGYSSIALAGGMAQQMGARLIDTRYKQHEDREIGLSFGTNIRGNHAVIVASGAGDPNKAEKETRLMLRTADEHGADSVTLVIPYMWYGRSDDKWDERQVAALKDTITTLRPLCDDVLVLDAHNASLTRELFLSGDHARVRTCETVHMAYPYAKFLKRLFNEKAMSQESLMFMHADAGSTKRISRNFRSCMNNVLGLNNNPAQDDWAVAIKDRDKDTGKSRVKSITADVTDKDIVIFEDMVASGGTLVDLAERLKTLGARSVTAFATHGLFTTKPGDDPLKAIKKIEASALDRLLIANAYNYAASRPEKAAAIKESKKIITVDASAHLARITSAFFAKADLEGTNSISAMLAGRHPYQVEEIAMLNGERPAAVMPPKP